MHRPLIWASLAAAMAAATAGDAPAQTVYLHVDDDAPEGGDGLSWQTAYRDLQDALDAARCLDPVEIRVADGLYIPSGAEGTARDRFLVDALRGGCGVILDPPDFDAAPDETLRFYADDSTRAYPNLSQIVFSIRGAFAGLLRPDNPDLQDPTEFTSVLSGDRNGDDAYQFHSRFDNCSRVLEIHSRLDDATLLVEHLTIRGGNARHYGTSSGGGVYISATSGAVSLNECLMTSNDADDLGGGLFVADGYFVQLYRCTFVGNRARFGGAVYAAASTQPHYCVFDSNIAIVGGGAVASASPARTSNSVFANNTATIGGALHSTHYSSFFGCLFVGNSAEDVSAVATPWTSMTNCTLIQEGDSTPAVVSEYGVGFTNCVLVRGGSDPIAALTPGYEDAILGMVASLIDDDEHAFELSGATLVWEDSIVAPPRFLDPLGSDGLATTWQDNDYRPGPGARAIDAGHSDRTVHCRHSETDSAGNPRLVDAWNYLNTGVPCRNGDWMIDMGAFEAPADTPRLCNADWNNDETVDINDAIAFLGEFDDQALSADLNSDTIWDFFDLQLFLRDFSAGCP